MAGITTQLPSYEELREIRTEQIVRAFGFTPNIHNKIICPFHQEEEPSLLINEHYCYCFGCKKSWDNLALVQALLNSDIKTALRWFVETKLPEPSQTAYEKTNYEGPVNLDLIQYWQDCMVDESYRKLFEERRIRRETAEGYKIGWRPDFGAWSIPFWRGIPGESEVDIVQFRMAQGKTKYIGLKGHSRGSVMNAHLLREEQSYIVIMMGSFDAILALQDGVLAVGINGSNPFREDEKERVKELFLLQKNILVLPDNTQAEFKPAYKLAEWLGGKVIFFPSDTPPDTDYIDYRKSGKTVLEFKQDILQLNFPYGLLLNICELWKCGDPYNFAPVHATMAVDKAPLTDIVQELSKLSGEHIDLNVTKQEFLSVVEQISYRKAGGW